ncbi:MAG: lipopolysaccharide biosynthesis protein [Solirubrobacterales bacterium]
MSTPRDAPAAPGEEAKRYGKTAGLLGVGVGATGLITYLFFALASHNLTRQEYGELVVLWSAIFITVSVLYRPVEQLLSRTLAEHEARGEPIAGAVRIAATIQAGLALLFAVLALAFRTPLTNDLLSGNETLYWILVAAVFAYAASYFARGFFAGTRRFPLYATVMISESIARTCFALAVALGIATGQSAIALGIAVAPFLSLLVVPLAIFRSMRRDDEAVPPPEPAASADRSTPDFTLAHGSGFAAAVLLIMLAEQTFLNAGPLLVNASSGAAAAGFIFNVLMIARAPLQLFQAVATSLLPHLTRLRSAEAASGEDAFRISVRSTLWAIVAFAGLAALVVALAGPELMQIAFGDKFSYDRAGLLIVTAGMGLYLLGATLNQAAVAQGQVRRAAACWVACAIAFVAWNLVPVSDEFRQIEVGFTVSAGILAALLYLIYRNPHGRAEDIPAPDSPEELEARLASADEVG